MSITITIFKKKKDPETILIPLFAVKYYELILAFPCFLFITLFPNIKKP